MRVAPLLLLNALLLQIGWWLCVAGGNRIAAVTAGVILLVHALVNRCELSEWLCIVLCASLGVLLDGALHAFGILQFATPSVFGVPFWLVAVWLIFATTLNHSLRWLQTHRYWAIWLGASTAPLSYWGGVQLGAAHWGRAIPQALAIIALCWGLLLPLLSAMMRHRTRVQSLCCGG